jgi:hypothetical protein
MSYQNREAAMFCHPRWSDVFTNISRTTIHSQHHPAEYDREFSSGKKIVAKRVLRSFSRELETPGLCSKAGSSTPYTDISYFQLVQRLTLS